MSDYERIETAIRFVDQNAGSQPALDDVAAHVGLSPFHLQRVFKRWAGLSPKRFLQFLTVEHAKQMLRESRSVLDTAYAVGLSGPGRLHDLFVSVEAMTPGEFKRGVDVHYGVGETPFGDALVGMTDRGICALDFGADAPHDAAAQAVLNRIFSGEGPFRLHLGGTNFQIKVWNALLQIPEGAVVSYGDLARRLAIPDSTRAVASAVAQNPIGYLIPCHRVLRSTGETSGYRWGTPRKKAMLAYEFTSSSSCAK